MSTESHSQSPERVSDLWFDDGSLVVRAGDRLFKVYRGILAAQSSVFFDMFSFPPSKDQEIVDGCPLVELPDDPQSVELFLRAVLQPNFFLPPPAIVQYHIIGGVIRIAHKYECAIYRERALRHLSAWFPCTIEDYIHRPPSARAFFDEYSDDGKNAYGLDTLALLFEVDARWCLPVKYLGMTKDCAVSIINGVDYQSQHYEITPDHKAIVTLGRERILDIEVPKHMKTLAAASPDCDEETCSDARVEMLTYFIGLPLRIQIEPWNNHWFNGDWPSLCQDCLTKLWKDYREIKIKLWNLLPEIFGLPSWEELKKSKKEALGYVKEYHPSPTEGCKV